LMKPDTSLAIKTGHLDLLTTRKTGRKKKQGPGVLVAC
jgi:hypothetical protein